uniref:NADH:ubiquinone reductase (H(+)-translocating) n=1 Tax=Chiropterargas boueti TaxID=1827022 RepID=A0A1P8AG82_9ACAR|nr:NADH dehydrogenase subunit 5 [Chiropterargas boueti]AMX74112.1 NADH dehydrogenase subunit 5 [Chiropterargas boueti]
MVFIYWCLMLMYFFAVFFMFFMKFVMCNQVIIIEYYLFSFMCMDVKLYLLLDWVSLLFVSVVLLISSMLIIYSSDYMFYEKYKYMYCVLMLLFVFSMVMLILCPNLFMILLGWDGLGLVSYCLVVYYQNSESGNAGMITILSNKVGDIMLFLSIVFFVSLSNLDMVYMNNLYLMVGIMMIIAGMTKSAQIPFSAWLPKAMAAPTPVSSLVHSSTLVAAGVYLLIRLNMLFSVDLYSTFLLYISLSTMLMSGVGAMFEMDLKKIVALSTLSQLSLMMLILSINMWQLSLFHLMTHALFKATLFMCVGYMLHDLSGDQDIRSMGMFYSKNYLVGMVYSISIMTLFGFPFLSAYYSKDLILEYIYVNSNLMTLLLAILGMMTTCFYSVRIMYYSLFLGELKGQLNKLASLKYMEFSIYVMGMVILLFGALLSWMLLQPSYIYVMTSLSVLNLLLIFTSMLILVIYFSILLPNSIWLSLYFSEMWFLSKLCSMMSTSIKEGQMMEKWDKGWLEMVGPQGIFKYSLPFSNKVLWLQYVSFYNMILFFIVMMMLL